MGAKGAGPILVVGSSGHAKVVLDIFEVRGTHRVVGLIDPHRDVGETVLGYPVLGREEDLPKLARVHEAQGWFVAIGDNWTRHRVAERVAALLPSLGPVSAVHPRATIARSCAVGRGVAIMAGTVVNCDSRIEDFCILNTSSSLDHDCLMETASSLAPQTITGGNVRIGTCTAVGLGAQVIHGIQIGAHTVVGAGALVLRDIPERCVAYGVPARVIRPRKEDEPYL
jgi:sugar O-acyltransferase (sialic acid O-acetyltransferase NeuD family)